jgi:LemA protein
MGIIITLGVIAVIAVVLALLVIGIYNKLVSFQNRYENAFAQIEVQLKRRHDLIPNLVETAKGYMAHEKGTLEAVVEARNQAATGLSDAAKNPGDPNTMQALAGAESQLTGAMGRLFAVMEAYPDLKANQNMMALQEEITATENKVAFSRQAFNDSVTAYNTYRESFPPVIVAPIFGQGKNASLLEFADSAQIQEAPKVSFS